MTDVPYNSPHQPSSLMNRQPALVVQPGQILLKNRYLFTPKSALGRGQFSKVFRGIDTDTELPVAIKRIVISNLNPHSRERILAEINICTSLHHDNIVETYDVATDEKYLYIIMELCSGEYTKMIPKSGMKETKARYYMIQLVKAFQYLYGRSIFHRDVKPSNILVSMDGKKILLADFGFSIVLDHHKMAQTICGTPVYSAPELRQNEHDGASSYSDKSDLWSLGLVIYESIYGKNPFMDAMKPEELAKMQMNPIPYPTNVAVSGECIDLMHGLLRPDPYLRIGWTELFQHPWVSPENLSRPFPISLPISAGQSRPIPINNQGVITGSRELLDMLANTPEARTKTPMTGTPPVRPLAKSPSITGSNIPNIPRSQSRAIPHDPIVQRNVSISLGHYVMDDYIPSSSPPNSTSRDGTRSDDGPIAAVRAPSMIEEHGPTNNRQSVRNSQGSLGTVIQGTRKHSAPASIQDVPAAVPNDPDSSLGLWGLFTSSIKSMSIFGGGGGTK